MDRSYDLVVIGSGTAGRAAAEKCRTAGWSVAVVDSLPFGGTCSLRGCNPKKVLVNAARSVDWVRQMRGNGVAFSDLRIDWPELMRFKRSFTDPITDGIERTLAAQGIEAIHAEVRFSGRHALTVGNDEIDGRFILIATGAKPAKLNIPGDEHLTTSDEFLELNELPRRIAMLGGGYVSLEFAHIAARAGAEVTVIHRGKRPLERFDPDLADLLLKRTADLGIEVMLESEATAITENAGGYSVIAARHGKPVVVDVDLVVHGAGRPPNIDRLDLPAANVDFGRGGVTVNEFLQSVSNDRVYAAGDAASSGTPPLTPMAEVEGAIAAENMIGGNLRRPDAAAAPSVVFTIPALATVGLTEQAARDRGLRFRTEFSETSSWMGPRRAAEPASGHKVLVEEETERILGAHLIGHGADEVINVFAVAIRYGLAANQIASADYGYPTMFSDVEFMFP